MPATLYDLIMGNHSDTFTKDDWAALGRGEIKDEETIGRMLMEGYQAVADND